VRAFGGALVRPQVILAGVQQVFVPRISRVRPIGQPLKSKVVAREWRSRWAVTLFFSPDTFRKRPNQVTAVARAGDWPWRLHSGLQYSQYSFQPTGIYLDVVYCESRILVPPSP
jgi:hypothetical protein